MDRSSAVAIGPDHTSVPPPSGVIGIDDHVDELPMFTVWAISCMAVRCPMYLVSGQWVLSLPFALRAPLAYEPGLMSVVARVFEDSPLRWYEQRLAPGNSRG
jgi:hypothetical protein